MHVANVNPEAQKDFAENAVRMLRAAGFESYWAGGCVRDLLLGGIPKDYDVATSATPKQVRKVFRKYHTLGVGAAFGVMIVVGPRGAGQLDVATFRADDVYSDGRRPDSVTYSTAEEDVKRRDFTINGLLFDPLESRVIDYVGGQEDLKLQVVRAIGDPAARLAEDKLRMLRAVRFASRFGFLLEAETRAAIESKVAEITVVSAERITEELRAMLAHPTRAAAISLCREVGLLQYSLPEAEAAHAGREIESAWKRTLRCLGALEGPSFPLALTVLLRDYSADANGRARAKALLQVGKRMRISNDDAQRLDWLVRNEGALNGARSKPWSQVQRLLIDPGAGELIDLHQALLVAETETSTEHSTIHKAQADLEFCRERLQLPDDELNPSPLVTGDDLIACGIPRGKHYQQILTIVRDAQLDAKIGTRDAGLELANETWLRLKSERLES